MHIGVAASFADPHELLVLIGYRAGIIGEEAVWDAEADRYDILRGCALRLAVVGSVLLTVDGGAAKEAMNLGAELGGDFRKLLPPATPLLRLAEKFNT